MADMCKCLEVVDKKINTLADVERSSSVCMKACTLVFGDASQCTFGTSHNMPKCTALRGTSRRPPRCSHKPVGLDTQL